ncbi:MAG TPA: HAMP domain-containing sensor histidine kinase [Vicinamibacterales bacterium]|nr:HAMP domain-containing sensor histidine kinase [Vicinamibacterales bacterium]
MRFLPALPRDVRRLAVIGAALALAALGGGLLLERYRLGADDAAAFARVEADVTRELEAMSDELRGLVTVVAGDAERIARAARGDEAAAADLFAAIEAAHTRHDDRVAITVYGPSDAIAWSDGPAEDLPDDRVSGPEALFAADGTLGLRLVYVLPVYAPDGARVGAAAAERILVPVLGVPRGTPGRVLEGSLAPVRLLTRYEGAGQTAGPNTFLLTAKTGEVLLQGHVDLAALAEARARLRRGVWAVAALLLVLTLGALVGPILDARQHAWSAGRAVALTVAAAAVIAGARWIVGAAVPPFWKDGPGFDVFATGAMLLSIAAVVAPLAGQMPIALRRRRRFGFLIGLVVPLAAGMMAAFAIKAYAAVLARLSADPNINLLDFSLYPLSAERLFLVAGLVLLGAATIWLALLSLLASDHIRRRAVAPWSVLPWGRYYQIAAWLIPSLIVFDTDTRDFWPAGYPHAQVLAAVAAAAAGALLAPRARRYYAHASHAMRLLSIWLLLILPALALYPLLVYYADRATRDVIEREYGPRTSDHTGELQAHLSASLARINALSNLPALVAGPCAQGPQAAFFVWDSTPLGDARLTSAVELYGPDGCHVSRFALNLPEVDAISQTNVSASCDWEVFGEVNRFGSEERRMLHAERALCDEADVPRGTIVVHVMPDYRALPFIAAANPYLEVLRGGERRQARGVDDLQVAIYGWGLLPLFSSGPWAWQITPDIFDRLYRSRDPFWTSITHADDTWQVLFRNDRAGIYAIGYPALTAFDVFVHGAELATLAGIGWILILAGAAVFLPVSRRRMNVGRVMLREIRTSFYRKLLLAFVAASIVPVIVLALVLRAYTAGLLREDVEEEASRTVAVAQRSIENYAAGQPGQSVPITDDLMVQLSQILGQEINLFEGPSLLVTSAFDLFESGLLPRRTPAQVYRKIALERLTSFVGEERIGDFPYLLAATRARTAGREVILSVPLLTRRGEIEAEIEDLERGIHLAAVVFILLGSALGLYMAERIADPVRRLTRATRRIASGDFDARIAIRTADELQRLVDDFNRMAEELKAQRDELKRSQRLAAWAEMARQVAHEIKNPLTPIQLSAEHLRRVHIDRGEPMSPVLQQCVDSILTQVTLLRQISSEFSAFASSPTVRPADVDLGELVGDIVAPYRAGLPAGLEMVLDVEAGLPRVRADRTLLGRAVTNLIENGLHAMPGGGRLTMTVARDERAVLLRVADTGIGMDQEALERAFEPYFSTKATGTGLGLPIARRNVELNGGTISVDSARGRGTTVTVRMPASA